MTLQPFISLVRRAGAAALAVSLLTACAAPAAAPQTPAAEEAGGAVTAQGRLEPRAWLQVSFGVGGALAEVAVAEGQTVQAGDVLAVLEAPVDLAFNQRRADQEYVLAAQQLTAAQEASQVNLAQAALAQASAARAIEAAQERLDDLKQAQADQPEAERPTDLQIAEAEAQLFAAQAAQADAARRYAELTANSGLDQQYEAANVRLKAAQAQVDSLAAAEAQLTLRAPAAGTVVGLNLKAGERLQPGQSALTLVDFSGWVVKTDDLTELEVVTVQPGQAVTLRFDALPGLEVAGVVASIAAQYEEKRGDITYTVTIQVKQPDPQLRWGMTTAVEFLP